MIADLLPRYYVAHGTSLRYNIARSILVDGHEVAWMKYSGNSMVDSSNQGRESFPFEGYELVCECTFTEGIGWQIGEDGFLYNLGGPRNCLKRKAALYLRHLELRQEYTEHFYKYAPSDSYPIYLTGSPADVLLLHAEEIILDLISKAKVGEFLEESNGASFWGGHFYLQTVAAIIDRPMPDIWEVANRMVAEKKISLESAVVQTYHEPPPPSWTECLRVEDEGWVGVASLPAHSRMKQVWQLVITSPEGKVHRTTIPLEHAPTFGPDEEDVNTADEQLHQLIAKAMGGEVPLADQS